MDPQPQPGAPAPPHSVRDDPPRTTTSTGAGIGTETGSAPPDPDPATAAGSGSPRAIDMGNAYDGTDNGVKNSPGRPPPPIGAIESHGDVPRSSSPSAAQPPDDQSTQREETSRVADEYDAAAALAGINDVPAAAGKQEAEAEAEEEGNVDSDYEEYVPTGYYEEEVAWRMYPPRPRPRPGTAAGGDAATDDSKATDDRAGTAIDGIGGGATPSAPPAVASTTLAASEEGVQVDTVPSNANGGDDGNNDASIDDAGGDDDTGPGRRLRQRPVQEQTTQQVRPQRGAPSVVVPPVPLDPLPPAPPLPPLPSNWSFDEETRVLLGNFRDSHGDDADAPPSRRISVQDQEFMLRMMERDDITVVVEGLIHPERLDPGLWSMDYLEKTVGNDVYHRFRVFERVLEVEGGGDGNGAGGRKGGGGRKGKSRDGGVVEGDPAATAAGGAVPISVSSSSSSSGAPGMSGAGVVAGAPNPVGVAERVVEGRGNDARGAEPAVRRPVPQDAAPPPQRSRPPPKKRLKMVDAHHVNGSTPATGPNGFGTGLGGASSLVPSARPEVIESRSGPSSNGGNVLPPVPVSSGVTSVETESSGVASFHVTYRESGVSMALRIRDFVRYLNERKRQLSRIADRRRRAGLGDGCNPLTPEEDLRFRRTEEEIFRFTDHEGLSKEINCVDVVLYLIDYDIVKLLPSLHRDFVANFRFPEILPGAMHCLMNAVNPGGRPFMGPNLYVTPPASFTHFHQDGHGTVDSGHQCLTGYNEVIMLRRMTEEHKKNALSLLNGGKVDTMHDALYGLPHADGAGEMIRWPKQKDIQACKEMNYYPSVFILKPGQFVHINKGRLHAFRKLAPTNLPAGDCHADLRSTLLKQKRDLVDKETLCVSVAWDWTYKGVTSEGTNRETAAILECASLNRKHHTVSLAIPETSLLHIARDLTTRHELGDRASSARRSLVDVAGANPPSQSGASKRGIYTPKPLVTLRGILPSLRHVVERHREACALAQQRIRQIDGPRVSVSSRPNTWENPQKFSLDPYGNDFFCKLCHEELSNLYMHCDGCEILLNKDFNICVSCHTEGKHLVKVQMHPLNDKRHSTINHMGSFRLNRQSRCPCKNGPACKNCTFCSGCSCKCHQWFTLHFRLMDIGDETKLLERVESAVGDDPVRFSAETRKRLLACKPEPPPSTATQDDEGTAAISDQSVETNVLVGLKNFLQQSNIQRSTKAGSAPKTAPNKPVTVLSREERKKARDSRAKSRSMEDAAPQAEGSNGNDNTDRAPKKDAPKRVRPTRVLIDAPHDHDVLYGRDRSKTHPGNEKLRRLARQYWSRYNASSSKKDVAREILHIIRSSDPPGRFLRPNAGQWYEVDEKESVVKVCHVVADLHKNEQKSKGRKR